VHFDASGKVSLDHIYTKPDPRDYFGTLRALDYRIPQLAKPYFRKLIREYGQARQVLAPNILDIGCSYGINAALLRCDVTMDELYGRYAGGDAAELTHDTLLARDRGFVRSRNRLNCARFVGLDVSQPALSYALAAGFIDAAVHANLEQHDPTPPQREQLAGTDLVISTGCLGYVTHRTVSRVVTAIGERQPWMAHFVLRMFPFEPVEESLAGLGYATVHLDRVFKQRRFASPTEQSLVLDTLSGLGVDPQGLETDGWLYAQLHISRPLTAKSRTVIDLAMTTEGRQ
jgi:SAM-dependent methyltransferase